MRRLRGMEDDEQEVDISPLIDVVFILLIFFMVSTTFVKDAQLELERPSAQSAEPADGQIGSCEHRQKRRCLFGEHAGTTLDVARKGSRGNFVLQKSRLYWLLPIKIHQRSV